jgi:hypothetical protein
VLPTDEDREKASQGVGTDGGAADTLDQEPDDGSASAVHLHTRPMITDYFLINAALARRSKIVLGIAGLMVFSGVVGMATGNLVSAVFALLGLAMATGAYCVPFTWFAVRRRADLLLSDVDVCADLVGLTIKTRTMTSSQEWSVYRRVTELREGFVFDSRSAVRALVVKRGAEATELAALRTLLESKGLRPQVRSRLRSAVIGIAAFSIGALIVPGYVYVQNWVDTQGANAGLTMKAVVNGRSVAVAGDADLPEGSIVAIELTQLDEYDRATAAGAPPDPADSPWVVVHFVKVDQGMVVTRFDVPSWPSGRASASAFFWMFEDQPADAVQRYGPDGATMTGPGIVQTSDRGRMLEVATDLRLP